MRARRPIPPPLQDQINVTPLVDVCLVILLIFMVVMPYLTPGRPVELPKALDPQVQPDSKRALELSVEADGEVFVGRDRIQASDVPGLLVRAHDEDPTRPVRLSCDRRLTFGDVKSTLKAAQGAGFKEVALMVRHVDAQGRLVAGDAAGESPVTK